MGCLWIGMLLVGCAAGGATVRQRAHEAEDRGDYYAATQGFLYEAKNSTMSQYDRTRDDANRVETKWIRAELAKLETVEPSVAYSKAQRLETQANEWILGVDLDHEIDTAIAKTVARMIPTIATPELLASDPIAARDRSLSLISSLDTDLAAPARDTYNKIFAELAAKETVAATDAAKAGRVATAFFHRKHADAYALGTDTATAEERAAVDKISGTEWRFDGTWTSCSEVDNALSDFAKSVRSGGGRKGVVHATIGTCGGGHEDKVTDSHKEKMEVGDGPRHDITTQDVYVDDHGKQHDVEGPDSKHTIIGIAPTHTESYDVSTHERTQTYEIHGAITTTIEGAAPTTSPLDFSDSITSKEEVSLGQVKFLDGGNYREASEPDKERAAALHDIEAAVRHAGDSLAAELAEKAASITDPDAHIEALLVAARAGALPAAAGAELTAKFHEPASDITALVAYEDLSFRGSTPSVDSTALEIPAPHADADAVAGSERIKPFIDARRPGSNVNGDFDVAPNQTAVDGGDSQLGLIVGFQVNGRVDPGPVESGAIAGIGWMLRLGYSNGIAIETGIPLWLGYRSHGIGLAALGEVGLNKFGSEGESPLWVNSALYLGYGAGLSVQTTSIIDVAASYLTTARSTVFISDETMAITSEDRYELRVNLVQPDMQDGEETIVKSAAIRYSSFDGGTAAQKGRMITLWLMLGAL